MSPDEFVRLVRDESGMTLEVQDLGTDLDELAGWDSVHLLKLLSALENASGAGLPVVSVLESRTLGEIHALVAG
jgi:acyl carrier protein